MRICSRTLWALAVLLAAFSIYYLASTVPVGEDYYQPKAESSDH